MVLSSCDPNRANMLVRLFLVGYFAEMGKLQCAHIQGADRVGGWTNHFKRTKRWQERAVDALANLSMVEFNQALDYALAYFVWCHSLREWLIKDGAFPKHELDDCLRRHPEWKIVRDLANRSRHLVLIQNPTDKDWAVFREYDHFASQLEGREKHHMNLFFNGQRHRLIDIILASSLMWEQVLSSKELL